MEVDDKRFSKTLAPFLSFSFRCLHERTIRQKCGNLKSSKSTVDIKAVMGGRKEFRTLLCPKTEKKVCFRRSFGKNFGKLGHVNSQGKKIYSPLVDFCSAAASVDTDFLTVFGNSFNKMCFELQDPRKGDKN